MLLFHHVGPGVQDQIVRLGGKCPYLLRHISSPYSHHYFKCLFIICVWVFYVCAPHCGPGASGSQKKWDRSPGKWSDRQL